MFTARYATSVSNTFLVFVSTTHPPTLLINLLWHSPKIQFSLIKGADLTSKYLLLVLKGHTVKMLLYNKYYSYLHLRTCNNLLQLITAHINTLLVGELLVSVVKSGQWKSTVLPLKITQLPVVQCMQMQNYKCWVSRFGES